MCTIGNVRVLSLLESGCSSSNAKERKEQGKRSGVLHLGKVENASRNYSKGVKDNERISRRKQMVDGGWR